MKELIELLEKRGIKSTPNRILVLDALNNSRHPVSLLELDTIIQTMGKSSIFRVLNLFLDHHIVHGIEDGSSSLKYELCHGEDHHSLSDMHVHFYCEKCHSTFCFEGTPIPPVTMPDGFEMESINYMIKGHCPKCRDC